MTQPQLDWQPSENESSIGSILYHMALIEADWLYAEVLEQEYAADKMSGSMEKTSVARQIIRFIGESVVVILPEL